MSNPTPGNLMTALRNADAAGDTEAAHRIAAMIRAQSDITQVPTDQLQAMLKSQPDISQVPTAQLQEMLKHRPDPTGPDAFNPTSGMSTGQKLLAGIGQGMTDAYSGANQLGAHLANSFLGPILAPGMTPEMRKLVAADADQEAKDKAQIDKPLLATGAGHVGNWLGNAATTAPLMGVGAGEAAAAKFLPMLAKAAETGAVQGGLAGAVQPVTNGDYASGKTGQVATGAILGGGLNAIGAGGLAALKNVTGGTVGTALNTINKAANKSEFAQEGENLVQRTGVNLTPGEISGSKAQISLENNARQSIASKNMAFAADQAKAQQWVDYVNKVIDNVAPSGGNAAEVGQRVQGAVKNAVSDMTAARNTAADADYGQIRTLLQGKPAVIPQNYRATLDELAQQFAGGPKGSDYEKLSNAISSLQDNSLQNADLSTLMKTRRFLSQVAGGQVQLAGDTGRGMQSSIAKQLLGAIDQDLDASAQKIGGPVGDMLKQANARYRTASQQIEGLQKSALGKLVGADYAEAIGNGTYNNIPGETVMDRISQLKPSQLESAKGIMQNFDPDAWQSVKRSVLETALSKAQAAAPSEGANVLAARPNVFVNELAKTPEDQARLASIFSPKEQFEINDALNVARRMSDKAGFNFSNTAQNAELVALGGTGTAALIGHPVPLMAMGGKMLGNRAVASIMSNPEGRATIRQMAALPAGSNRFRELASKLAAIAGSQEVGQQ